MADKGMDLRPPELLPDETIDLLGYSGLRIIQPAKGARFSIDPVLLCAFCRSKTGEIAVDLGSGTGIIPLLLGQREPTLRIHGIEIQPEMADRARRSVYLNGLTERVSIQQGDIRDFTSLPDPQSCNIVLCNPPYRRPTCGRIAPVTERAISRHELHGSLADFVGAARFLLRDGGRFYAIFLAERLPELLLLLQQERIEPKRLRFIHSRHYDSATLVLVEARRNGRPGCAVDAPLFLYQGVNYSPEVLEIFTNSRIHTGRDQA